MKRFGLIIALVVALSLVMTSPALAGASSSPHYVLSEPLLGGTGLTNSQSAHYQASGSGGAVGSGNSTGTNYQINAGHQTTNDPALSFSINTAAANLGSFSTTAAATTTATFSVLDYTSYGYSVQIYGNPPTNGAHTIAALASASSSSTGVEQFGINLVANTSPASVGANPDHGQFGVGSAATNYNTANKYRFVSGDTIATGPSSGGQTNYTITYLVNVGSLTPGGQYSTGETLICLPTY